VKGQTSFDLQHFMQGASSGALCIASLMIWLVLGACSAEKPLVTNSIADELNRGGQHIVSSERRFELAKVEHLAETLPACIAYRLPEKPPQLSDSLKDTLRVLVRTFKREGLVVETVHIHHARLATDTAAAYPTEVILGITEALRPHYPSIKVRYSPVAKDHFRKVAMCGSKDTAFVDRERLTSYSKELPGDLIWSGRIHIADALFIRLTGPGRPQVDVAADLEKQPITADRGLAKAATQADGSRKE
jgi:hypothetical protein